MLQGNWDWTEIEGKSGQKMRVVLCRDIRVIQWALSATLDPSDKASV